MQSRDEELETETEILRDRHETWDLRDRDVKNRVSRPETFETETWKTGSRDTGHVSRPRPSLETPSLSDTFRFGSSGCTFHGSGFYLLFSKVSKLLCSDLRFSFRG